MAAASGQGVSLPSAEYRVGRYVPLRIDAEAAGEVVVRGDRVQAVEWPAPGRSSVVVPVLIYGDVGDSLALTVNGRPVSLALHALASTDADPPELAAFRASTDPAPVSAGDGFDDDAYPLAALWQPGRDPTTRRWVIGAVAVIVLSLGVAAHADPKRPTRWLVATGVVLSAGVVAFFPADTPRRLLSADGRPGWDWVWQAATSLRVAVEPWSPGLRFVAQSADRLKSADPTLHCDASGRPISISARVDRGGRAVFVLPRPAHSRAASSPVLSPRSGSG